MRNLIATFILFLALENILSQQLPNLPIPLGAGTVQVYNNQIFYFGGSNNWGGSIIYPRIYRFDGTTWSYYDTIPDNNLWDVRSAIVGDNVYLIGGWPSGANLTRRYNISTKQWVTLANCPNTQTWGITTELINDRVYLINSSGRIWEYNIPNNTWTEKTALNASGSWDLSSIVYNNEIYVLGFANRVFYKYNPITNTWSRLADSPVQIGATSMGIINNFVYCAGGNNSGGSNAFYQTIWRYDINSNSWAVDTRTLSSKRHWMARAIYKGGMYVLGGFDSLGNAVNIVEEIVPQGTGTDVGNNLSLEFPQEFYLYQNYPNPFNPSTKIIWQSPVSSWQTLKIYDLLGNEVAILVNEFREAGKYEVEFPNVETGHAMSLPSGVYFYQLRVGNYVETKKMILSK